MGMGRGRAGIPPPPLDPGPTHFEALPIQGAWQEFPSSPGAGKGDGGWDWSELLGEETEITLPSTHGGLRSRPGQSSVPRGVEGELLGGMRLNWLEGKEKRAGALEPKQLSLHPMPSSVGCGGSVGRSGRLEVSHGAVRSTDQSPFPHEPEPFLTCPAQPPTPQSGPVYCADLTSAKSGDSRGH